MVQERRRPPVCRALGSFKIRMNIKKRFLASALAGIVLATGTVGMKVQAAVVPSNLHCALRVDPLGIGDPTPRLSWQLQSVGQARGETQSAYQIQVGSSPGTADLWDSGKVISSS